MTLSDKTAVIATLPLTFTAYVVAWIAAVLFQAATVGWRNGKETFR